MTVPVPAGMAERLQGLSPARRVMAAAIAVAMVVAVFLGSSWAAGPAYTTLFRGLDPADVSKVSESLAKAGVPYKLGAEGHDILVPSSDEMRAKAMVAAAKGGLPRAGRPGMELFDRDMWGRTDFDQHVTYQRALEGELARTVSGFDGIELAEVHLTLAEQSPLRRLEKPAEAAVTIKAKPGVQLTSDNVQAIAALVAQSVPGLPADNVAVIDVAGMLLTAPNDESSMGLTSRQQDLEHRMERALVAKAEKQLGMVFGGGNAQVTANVLLNFEQRDRTTEQFDPDKTALKVEGRSESPAEGGDAGGGPTTVVQNTYDNTKVTERVVESPGTIRRLTVSVLINEQALLRDAQKGTRTAAQQLAAVDTMVRNAIGIDSARGDRISVSAMPFGSAAAMIGPTKADDKKPKADPTALLEKGGKPALMVVGLLLAFALGWRALKAPTLPEGLMMAPPLLAGAATGAAAEGALSAGESAPLPVLPPLPSLPPSQSALLKRAVQEDSALRPETAAQVMRAWLAEDS